VQKICIELLALVAAKCLRMNAGYDYVVLLMLKQCSGYVLCRWI